MASNFDIDRFVEECRAARKADSSHKTMREVVARAVSEPTSVINALGEPQRAGVQKLYHAPDLTILNLVWGPQMMVMPHNHGVWAVIGVYTGREDNIFWRRLPDSEGSTVEAAGAKTLGTRDAAPLGHDIIHSVVNPLPRFTGAIHVYGGDFFAEERSEWDPETLREGPYDFERTARLFADANSRLG